MTVAAGRDEVRHLALSLGECLEAAPLPGARTRGARPRSKRPKPVLGQPLMARSAP
jgi:hypothetical protein